MTGLAGAALWSVDDLHPSAGIRRPQSVAEAARQFEALLIEQLLKTMRQATQPDENKDAMSGGDTYLEMAEQQLARLLAERGGLGLAGLLERGLAGPAAPGPAVSAGSTDKKTEGNTGQVRP